MKNNGNITRSRGTAFTLIELLIVIGIVTALILIGLPATQNARARALTAQCAGNLKNIGAALNLYAADNRYYPGAVVSAGTFWVQVADEYMGQRDQPTLDKLSKPFRCPARAAGTGTFGIGYGYNYAGFGFSENSSGGAPLPPDQMPPRYWNVSPSRVVAPSKTILAGDGLDQPTPGTYAELYLYLNNFDVLAIRHGGGANYVFADGHVEYLTPTAVKALFDEGHSWPLFPF